MAHVAIIGGGIAGLTAAHRLHRSGIQVTVLEAAPSTGGVIRSERTEGYLVEHGPNTVQTGAPALDDLIGQLGLEDEIVETAPAARKRYVVRDGKPVALPSGPLTFLSTRALSPRARLDLLKEPFLPPSQPTEEETVADFFRRRFGDEVLDYAVNPFVAGIFAGDPAELSLQHAFPRLYELEQQHGSVIGGMLKQKRKRGPGEAPKRKRRMFSFREGLQALPDALAATLEGNIHLGATLSELRRDGSKWVVIYHRGREPHVLRADAVLLTAPLHRLPDLVIKGRRELAPLGEARYAPVRIVALGFHAEQVAHALDGFGLLVPSAEPDYRILGALFSSTLFPDRAPRDHVLLTVFLGGERHPDLALGTEDQAYQTALQDVTRLLGIRGGPTFVRHVQWPNAIPQYRPGYGKIKEIIADLEEAHPGLFFAGNFRNGISLGDTVATATSVAVAISNEQ